jgi:hypothetical protein
MALMRQNTAFATRLYGILLHLYPSDFRQAYGDVMTGVFEESMSDAHAHGGTAALLKLWLHALTDIMTVALAEWNSRLMLGLGIEQRASLGATIAIHTIVLFSLILMGVNAGGLHPRPSTTPVCGSVKPAHASPPRPLKSGNATGMESASSPTLK